jgi:ElaB/YqjD/DUF883 family membrane-anchored ribosome-binding protein
MPTVDARTIDDTICLGEKAADAYRQVTHAVHEAKHAIRDGIENAADLRDTAVYRVKRNPLKAIGLAFGVGLVLGAVVGSLGGRQRD